LIGAFVPSQSGVTFYPSMEYLEAGKFKLAKTILKEKGEKEYEGLYTAIV